MQAGYTSNGRLYPGDFAVLQDDLATPKLVETFTDGNTYAVNNVTDDAWNYNVNV